MLLTVTNLAKAYGDSQVLQNVSLTMHKGDKWGLVGANGVGKSTLVKIITGEVEADAGEVQIGAGVEIGYLPQVLATAGDLTIGALIEQSQQRVHTLENQLRVLEQRMAAAADVEPILTEYGPVSEEFERLGGYDLDHRTEVIFTGLEISTLAQDRPISTLSGGEKSRVGLAALLLRAPELLLLDEPTNHLDFVALGWLEQFLQSYRGAILVVSHDRQFLNATVNAIIEVEEHSREAKFYSGNYDFFADVKAKARFRWAEAYVSQQEEIRELKRFVATSARQVAHNRPASDGDKFIYNFKGARVETTVARNVRAAEEKLRRIEADPIPKPPHPLTINPDFNPSDLVNKTPLSISQIRVTYGQRVLLDDITIAIGARDRIVIVGPNGAGKSTLLKIMAKRFVPTAGEVTLAASTVVGYLDQEQETLPQAGTLYDAYVGGRSGEWEELKAELMRYGLFTWPDLLKPVASLSVGQKRKLQLAQLIAAHANLLLLDEPTNHISFDVLEEFEQALRDFAGAIVAVSHDRRFIERVAEQVWELRDGRMVRYLAGWDEYHAKAKA